MKNICSGVYDATSFGAVCPQPLNGPLPEVLLPVWYRFDSDFMRNRAKLMSEDCLFANVYVPANMCKNSEFHFFLEDF